MPRLHGGLLLKLPALAACLTVIGGNFLTAKAADGQTAYQADFEAPAFVSGSIDGQQGWAVDQGRAEVTAGAGRNGSAGLLLLPLDPFSQARLSLQAVSEAAEGVSFVDLHIKPVAGAADRREEIIDVNSARIGLFRTEDPESAALWIFDGGKEGTGGGWLETAVRVPVDAATGRCLDWHRLTLREDTARQVWDVWLDGVWAAANAGFEEPRRAGQAVYIFMGDRMNTIALDDLAISPDNPLGADADHDGLRDELERALGSDPEADDRDADTGGTGESNIAKAAARESALLAGKVTAPSPEPLSISLPGGFLEAPASVVITGADQGGRIFYTLDGSDPRTEGAASQPYSGPLTVDRTTVCRAAARSAGGVWGPVSSTVWIFPARLAEQQRPEGWPEAFTDELKGGFGTVKFPVPWRMEELPGGDSAAAMEAALRAAPVVSLTVDPASLFDAEKGIYHRAGSLTGHPSAAAVAQVLNGDGAPVPVEAKVEISGESSRHHEVTLKHSLRLRFAGEELSIPGLGATGAGGGSLLLRHPTQDSWAAGGRWADLRPTARYYADALADAAMAAAGHGHLPRRFVHVYLNDTYWGLYEAVSQVASTAKGADGPMAADALLHGGEGMGARAVFGDAAPWGSLMARARSTAVAARDGWGQPGMWDALLAETDVHNLIDYILLNLWLGNEDWPLRNYLITQREGKFRFLSWDAELTMPHQPKPGSRITAVLEASDGPAGLFAALCWSPAFREAVEARLAEGVSPCFSDAALKGIMDSLRGTLRPLLPAEAARWGSWYEPGKDLMDLWERENSWVDQSWAAARAEGLREALLKELERFEQRAQLAAEAAAKAQAEGVTAPVPFEASVPVLADGSPDSDGDGIPDSWELAHGLNPHDSLDASADSDGDGFSNLAEYRRETDRRKAGAGSAQSSSPVTGVFTRSEHSILRDGEIIDPAGVEKLNLETSGDEQPETAGEPAH